MKKMVGFLMLLLVSTIISGCGVSTVSGDVNETLEHEDRTLTVNGAELFDRLVLIENNEEMDLTFEDGSKAILVDISLFTEENEVDHTNFLIESETDSEITPYEALSSEVEYHEQHNIINFNDSSKGNIEGNLVFSFSEEEIKNNTNTLVIKLDGVTFRVPLELN